MAIRLGDKDLAADAYQDLREQIIGAKQRRRDAHVTVALAPWASGPPSGRGSMFVVTVSWEYRVVPAGPVLRFSCVSDLDAFRELSADPASAAAWYFEPIDGLGAASAEVFELVQVSVDSKPRSARYQGAESF
ncbi:MULTISPECIES: hypothetical protein [unclassified Streptomyces]|uniref:hypothetical protein n=1 Tax=unclassified Streptomyces TaxID=2593676 RepID=UPI000B888E96|nr:MULTISPECIES: hypothetical protein [unclassified Streptomyces]MYS21215.1 hypothetical protein [Streptomyces sp. SID4948]